MLVTLSPRAVLRAEPYYFDQWVVFNTRTWKTFTFSRAQHEVLRRLAEQAMDDSLVYAQMEKYREIDGLSGPAFIENDILVYTNGEVPQHSLPSVPDQPIAPGTQCMSAPSRIEMCITRRCNELCHHCNISATSEKAPEKQPISFWLDVVDQCVASGVFKFTVTGGEPLLRKDFNVLLEKLVASPVATSILTNGLCITDEHIQLMKKANMSLGISLDGADAPEHDAFRRTPGAYDRTIAVMKRLGDAGICFTITVTVHAENLHTLPKFIEIAETVGANTLVFGPMGGVGRGATSAARKYLRPAAEIWEVLQEIIALGKLRTGKPEIVVANYEEREVLALQNGKVMARRHPGLCKAGIFALAIDEDGTVYPCLRGLQTRVHPIGNLTESSLQEIWKSHLWTPFRDKKLPRVPCRIEAIEESQKAPGPLNVLN